MEIITAVSGRVLKFVEENADVCESIYGEMWVCL